MTGTHVVGVRIVQAKQEQHVGHGAIHLRTHIMPLNDNIPPISMSTRSIAAQQSLTCLGLTATYAAVCQEGPAPLRPLFIESRNMGNVAVKTGAVRGVFVYTEPPTPMGSDAC